MSLKLLMLSLLLSLSQNLSPFAQAFEVRAHRGGTAYAPENLLETIKIGIEKGSDSIEFDIHTTADYHLVISHDPTLNRRCRTSEGQELTSTKPIYQMKLEEVRGVDCGVAREAEFPDQTLLPGAKIPTLSEALDLLHNSSILHALKVKYAIEVKYDDRIQGAYPPRAKLAKLLVNLLKSKKLNHRVMIISFDPGVLREIHKLNKKLPLELLVGDESFYQRLITENKDLGFPLHAILPYMSYVKADNVKSYHDQNIRVLPWYPNDLQSWQKMIEYGVDGITTDDPAGLLEYHQSRSK